MDELAAYMKENHENWMKDTIESIDDTEKPLRYIFLLLQVKACSSSLSEIVHFILEIRAILY